MIGVEESPTRSREDYSTLLKTSNGILKFLCFDWLTGNGTWAHIPFNTNMVADTRQQKQLGSSNIGILWAFLIKQLFHSRLLDKLWDRYSQHRRDVPRWLSTISYPTHARGIIVKKSLSLRRIIVLVYFLEFNIKDCKITIENTKTTNTSARLHTCKPV